MEARRFLGLVADDDTSTARLIEETLKLEGCEVTLAHDGIEALQRAETQTFNLAVIDLEMPGCNGQDVVRRLRQMPQGRDTFVLVLTSHTDLSDRIASFHAGADDFVAKPFELMELCLRVRAALRRLDRHQPLSVPIDTGTLALDPTTRMVTTSQGESLLSPMEFKLMAFLAEHAGEFFEPDALLQSVWGYPPRTGDPNLIRYHMRNLRRKIEPNPRNPRYVVRMPDGRYGLKPDYSSTSTK